VTRPALRAEHVTKTYGSGRTAVTAVAGADLELAEREFLALVGPSGSGKTTLLSIAGALLSPTEGRVTIGDVDVTALKTRQQTAFRAEQVGFVFQSFNLVPFLTARENLTIMGSFVTRKRKRKRKGIAERADRLLDELGLGDRKGNLPEQLSGGERQRVAIGRALINDPQLILVDEPTASLDTELGTQVVKLLASEISERGKAGIMVTHDERMVAYTDRTIRILDGRLQEATRISAE
jgi:putative ABC transport system ATP-binding protein